jgi:putative addiction module killer protein
MFEVVSTREFDKWLRGLADHRGRAKVLARIDRLALGNAGDVKPIGGGLSELRIDYGPGYRVYLGRIANRVVVRARSSTTARTSYDDKKEEAPAVRHVAFPGQTGND